MDTRGAPPIVFPVERREEARFLFLGNETAAVAGMIRALHTDGPPAAIILTSRIEPAELTLVLEKAPDPALPIADFGNNHGLRRDFVGGRLEPSELAEASRQFAPIERRLAELPFQASQAERTELTMLRLAYSRDAPIEARSLQNPKRSSNTPSSGPRPARVGSSNCSPISICCGGVISPALTNAAGATRRG
jgi:hypothetical protein